MKYGEIIEGRFLSRPNRFVARADVRAAGVKVLYLLCRVGEDSLEVVVQREG